MGIDTAIRQYLLTKVVKQGYTRTIATATSATEALTNTRPYMVAEDYLVRFRGKQGILGDMEISIRDLCRDFWAPVKKHIGKGSVLPCRMYVMIVDDRRNVTKLKQQTQADRKKKSEESDARKGLAPAVGYSDAAQLSTLETISLRRLGASAPRVRQRLWECFHETILELIQDCRPDTVFVFDHDAAGATWYYPDGRVLTQQNQHNLGEADSALIWWTEHCPEKGLDVRLVTEDTDLIPIYLLYHPYRRSVNIIWHWRTSEKDGDAKLSVEHQLELPLMAEQIAASHFAGAPGGPLLWFAFYCIICGTDIVTTKSEFAYYVGHEKMLENLKHYCEWVCAHKISADRLPPSSMFTNFLGFLYGNLSKSVKNGSGEPLKQVLKGELIHSLQLARELLSNKQKRYRVPDPDVITASAALVEHNMIYWYNAAQLDRLPPLPCANLPLATKKRKSQADEEAAIKKQKEAQLDLVDSIRVCEETQHRDWLATNSQEEQALIDSIVD